MMEKEQVIVVFTREDRGNSRFYYKTLDKPVKIFCEQISPKGRFQWFYCSRDGEPSHEVTDIRLEIVKG